MSRRGIGIVLALVVMCTTVLFLLSAEDTVDVTQSRAPKPALLVSTETVSVGAETVIITGFAEVRPRWSAELRTAVSGRIEEVKTNALTGERVEKGATLITIDDSQYLAELAAAELTVKEAELALSKAEKATAIARKQFRRDGTSPPNDLALHLPQLRIAETALASARAGVVAAKRRLEDASVEAPFSGYITERFVSPGQTVNPGDALVKLVDDRTFELTVEVGRDDWLLLRQPLAGSSAQVLDQNGQEIARARIRQGGGFLDEKTRQYKVFLEIKGSDKTSVLSGDFVRVRLPGITVPKALSMPESALTQEGYIWFLDDDDRLKRNMPRVLFRDQGRVIIRAPGEARDWRVAITPLVSFLPGQQVRAGTGG